MVASSPGDSGNVGHQIHQLFTNDLQFFSRPAGVKNHHEICVLERTVLRNHHRSLLVQRDSFVLISTELALSNAR
jgi:hypothetical protein